MRETINRLVDLIVGVAVESKAFAIYAMLFGAGMMAWAERGRALTRRLTTLACLGVVHMLLWNGDVLLFYGFLGLAVAGFTAASPRTQFAISALFLCIAAVPDLLPNFVPTGDQRDEWIRRAEQAYTSPHLRTLFAFRLAETYHVILPLLAGATARTLACMFAGMAAWKSRILPRPSSNLRLLARVAIIGMGVGLAATTLELASIYGLIRSTALDHTFHEVGVVALAAGYSAGALRLFSGSFARAKTWLARLGRLSLTCYITQSLVGGAIFYGYGLGQFGRLGSATALGLAATIYVLQGVLAPLLLRSGQGPLEKLWRYASSAKWPVSAE
jgi:uncharacterized protein